VRRVGVEIAGEHSHDGPDYSREQNQAQPDYRLFAHRASMDELRRARSGSRPLVLEASELALDSRAARVKLAPPGSRAWDERGRRLTLIQHGGGLALAGRAAPLGRAALHVRPANGHVPWLAFGRLWSPRSTPDAYLSGLGDQSDEDLIELLAR
jgi:hypothetical protein